jgi:hypothetical protein
MNFLKLCSNYILEINDWNLPHENYRHSWKGIGFSINVREVSKQKKLILKTRLLRQGKLLQLLCSSAAISPCRWWWNGWEGLTIRISIYQSEENTVHMGQTTFVEWQAVYFSPCINKWKCVKKTLFQLINWLLRSKSSKGQLTIVQRWLCEIDI